MDSSPADANGASLNGTLNISLINAFFPAIGNTFTILTCSALTGPVFRGEWLNINSGEGFVETHGATSLTLSPDRRLR